MVMFLLSFVKGVQIRGGESISASGYGPRGSKSAGTPVLTVKGLGEIYKVDIESSLPFGTLFNNISQCENMINTAPSSPETCLFFTKSMVHSQ